VCRDQRITQDVDRMTKTLSAIVADLLISPFTIVFYTYRTWSRSVSACLILRCLLVHGQVTIIFVVFVCLFV